MITEGDQIYLCAHCEKRYHIESITTKRNFEILPELKNGTIIYINNKEHKLNLEIGKIIARDHRHYQVEIGNKVIWMPEHWVEPLPKELMRDV